MHYKVTDVPVSDLDTGGHSSYGAPAFGTIVARRGRSRQISMAEQNEPPSFDDLDARLRAARMREDVETGRGSSARPPSSGLGLGMRLAVEVVVGIGVGTGLGWALDKWLGTRPWLMMVFLFLGGAAGVLNAYRVAKGYDSTVGLGEAQRRHSGRPKD